MFGFRDLAFRVSGSGVLVYIGGILGDCRVNGFRIEAGLWIDSCEVYGLGLKVDDLGVPALKLP